VQTEKKLLLIQELFRHGARFPIFPMVVDGSDYAEREKSVGELTTQGKKMHYLLGREIYKQYWVRLFGGTPYNDYYNNTKFFIKSTDVNRTIESCQSHMMGIFEGLPALKINQT
jgi:hypothetical protein